MQRVSAQPGSLVLRVSPLCFALLTVACGAPDAPRAPSTIPKAAAAPAPKRSPWPRFAEARHWPLVAAPFDNDGHVGEGALATVRVNPEARASYEHLMRDSELPDGAVVALFHRATAEGPDGSVYVMQKSGKIWNFFRLAPDGRPTDPPGIQGKVAGRCARCHAEGVADGLFGIPRSAGRRP